MKRSVLAMLMSALLICCLVLPVGAETVVKDGIEVTLTTDKESYSDLEVINAKLTIRNTNDYPIQNVRTEITVPEGYKLLDSGTMKIGTLAAGAEQVLQTNMRNLEADIPDLPQTGDDSHGGLWLLLMMLSGIALGIVIVKHKQANRVVSLFLCVAIISSFTLTAIPVYAETTEKAITVTKEVAVDGKRAVITGIVIYDYDVEMSATPTPTPTPTPTATPNTSALDYEYSISNGRVTILKYIGSEKNVVIPDTIEGYPVITIYMGAFYDNTVIESVIIPMGVTNIYDAFAGCTHLSSISIPDSVISIADWAFSDCSSLSNIKIPSNVKNIGKKAFCGCSSLRSITIPDGVVSIGNDAFGMCTSLNSISIPNSVTTIDDWAFQSCSSLSSVSIPNSVTSIGENAFAGCSGLKSIKIPSSITSISNNAFRACSSLNSVEIPNSVTRIGDSAFENCTSLSTVDIPNSVTRIGNMAFANSGLSSIEIPDSATSIGSGAFMNCSSLSSVVIPKGVTSIGNSAFYGSNNVTIYGYTNSEAEAYAKGNGIPFVAFDAPPATPVPTATPTPTPTATPRATPTPELAKPVLVHPALSNDEDSFQSFALADMTIVWGNVEGAVKYTVYVEDYWSGEWEAIIEEETTTEEYVIPEDELYEGGLFRVRIKAHREDGKTSSSDWYYFRVGAASHIELIKEEFEFDYDGGSKNVYLYTSLKWTAKVSQSWMTLNKNNGYGSYILRLEVSENTGDFPRTGTVTFTNGSGKTAVLTVIQEGNGSSNEGKLRITNPAQGDTLECEDISAEWSYRYDRAYYEVKLYDVTSSRTAYQKSQIVTDYTDIPESALTDGHIYQLTVSVYNAQGTKINQSSIVFKIEDNGSGGDTDPDDDVIETPEVPDGKTEIVYYGIEPKMDIKDISVSWDKVIGADYYAVALRDLTLYPDGTPDASVQKIINTTTQNLNYLISGSKLEQGHSYRLWIAAHKAGVADAITGKNILFTINAPEVTPAPQPVEPQIYSIYDNDGKSVSSITLDYTGNYSGRIYMVSNVGTITAWFNGDNGPFTLPLVDGPTLQSDSTYLYTYSLSASKNMDVANRTDTVRFYNVDENGDKSPVLAAISLSQKANPYKAIVKSVELKSSSNEVYNSSNGMTLAVGDHNGYTMNVEIDEAYVKDVFGDNPVQWHVYSDAPDVVEVYQKDGLCYIQALKSGHAGIYISQQYVTPDKFDDLEYTYSVCEVFSRVTRAILFGVEAAYDGRKDANGNPITDDLAYIPTKKDMLGMKDALMQYGVSEDDIVIDYGEIDSFARSLSAGFKDASDDDITIICISGHGGIEKSTNESFICMYGLEAFNELWEKGELYNDKKITLEEYYEYYNAFNFRYGVNESRLVQWVSHYAKGNVVLFISACHSGGFADAFAKSEISDSISVITACKKDQESYYNRSAEIPSQLLRAVASSFTNNLGNYIELHDIYYDVFDAIAREGSQPYYSDSGAYHPKLVITK